MWADAAISKAVKAGDRVKFALHGLGEVELRVD